MTRTGTGAFAPLIITTAALIGCASRYNRDLIDRREHSVYGGGEGASAPAADASAVSGADTVALPRTQVTLASTPPQAALLDQARLESYVAVALERSGRVRASFEEWRASAERVEQVSSLPDPRLTYSEYLVEVQTRTGAQQRAFGLAQTIPWPGVLKARARVVNEETEALWQRVESVRLEVERDVEVAFLDYAFLGRELEIRRTLAELLRDLESVVLVRVRAGAGQEDLLRIQVEVGRLDDDVARLRRRRPALSARLVATMNMPEATPELPLPVLEEPADQTDVDVDTELERALTENPELLALTRNVQARREGEGLAESSRWPDLTVGLSTIQTGDAVNPSTPGSGEDPVILSFSIPLPVWVSTDDAVTREAQHRLRAARARLDQAYANLVASVQEAAFSRDDANRRIALYRDSLIPRADESLQLTLSSYRAGSASVLDLIDSERALLEFQLSYWTACRSSSQARARLDALVGGEIR